MSDYHIHLAPHRPMPEPVHFTADLVERYVEVAAARGISEIAITEHVYRCKEALPILGDFWDDPTIPAAIAGYSAGFVKAECNFRLDNYVTAVQTAKDRGLPVKMGMEVDFFPESIEGIMDLIDGYPFDVLIGSVHWVGGWAVDSAETQSEFDRRGLQAAYRQYAGVVEQMAELGTLDVIGHVDVPKRYGRALAAADGAIFQPVVEAAARTGMAVEINSKGWKKPIGEAYPSEWLLARFHAAGVPITLSSDAHYPSEAGWGIDQGAALARQVGYATHRRYDQRVGYDVPLPEYKEMLT